MINSLHSNGDGLLLNVINQLQESRLFTDSVKRADIGRSFREIGVELIDEDGSLLIGLKRGDETILNPPNSFEIEENDKLLIFK